MHYPKFDEKIVEEAAKKYKRLLEAIGDL